MSSGVHSCVYLAAASLLFVSKAWAKSGSWGPWSECSKDCDGVQQQEWQCGEGDACESTRAPNTRKCNEHGCLTQEMLFAIVGIGGLIVILLLIILIVCIRRRRTKEKMIKKKQSHRYPETAENGGNNRKNSQGRRKSFHRFPSQKGEHGDGAEFQEKVEPKAEIRVHSVQTSSAPADINVYATVNPAYKESIQEGQAIFGPDDPAERDGLDSDPGSSSSLASTESGSSGSGASSADEDEVPPPIIYTAVEIVQREPKYN